MPLLIHCFFYSFSINCGNVPRRVSVAGFRGGAPSGGNRKCQAVSQMNHNWQSVTRTTKPSAAMNIAPEKVTTVTNTGATSLVNYFFVFRNATTFSTSCLFVSPANVIRVPGINFCGPAIHFFSMSSVQTIFDFFRPSE